MSLKKKKDYKLIVWWEHPRATFSVSGYRRKTHGEYVVDAKEQCELWKISGALQVDSTARKLGTFRCDRILTIRLKRDPKKTRKFRVSLDISRGMGYGAFDFLCVLSPLEVLTGSNCYMWFGLFPPSSVHISRILYLPPAAPGLAEHDMAIRLICSAQWDARLEVKYKVEALME